MKISILGGATTRFGELWNVSPRELVSEVANKVFKNASAGKSRIDAVFVGNMLSSRLGNQDHLGAFFSEELGLNVPSVKVEAACASGGMAVHLAVLSLLSGQYENVSLRQRRYGRGVSHSHQGPAQLALRDPERFLRSAHQRTEPFQ